MTGEQYLGVNNATLAGVVMYLPVILVFDEFTGAIRGGGNR